MDKIYTAKDLKEVLEHIDDSSPIFLGTWNGYADTYTVADHVIPCKFEEIENDFYGTRGKMDKRLFNPDFLGKDVLYIGSLFHRNIENKDIDFPSDANEPIELINGEDGDHELFWKSNGFTKVDEKTWIFDNDDCLIKYNLENKILTVYSLGKYHYEGECIGVEDFFDIMKSCKIQRQWRIG